MGSGMQSGTMLVTSQSPCIQGTDPPQQKFEGETDGLKVHVYDMVGSKSVDLFACTTWQVTSYVGQTYQHAAIEEWKQLNGG